MHILRVVFRIVIININIEHNIIESILFRRINFPLGTLETNCITLQQCAPAKPIKLSIGKLWLELISYVLCLVVCIRNSKLSLFFWQLTFSNNNLFTDCIKMVRGKLFKCTYFLIKINLCYCNLITHASHFWRLI